MNRIKPFAAIAAAATSGSVVAQPAARFVHNSDRSLLVAVDTDPRVPLDVPYLPTPEVVVTEMLRFADVTKTDVVYDLGCGDGRVVISATRDFGAYGVGVDLDPRRIREANRAAERAGMTNRVKFDRQDFFETNLRRATVVTMFLLPHVSLRLQPKLLSELRPGTRIISHMFGIGDWQADKILRVNMPDGGTRTIFGWTVTGTRPLKTQGRTAPSAEGNLIEQLGASGNFRTLVTGFKTNGDLFGKLTGPGPFTLFAPTDEAFAKLSPAMLKALTSDPAKMQKLLLSLIVPVKLSPADLRSHVASPNSAGRKLDGTVQTLNGAKIEFVNDATGPAGKPSVKLNGTKARIVGDEITARNGLIYRIDTVPAWPPD